ncbi:MAG: hypothetical protein NWE80_01465 [Candidatus Bathyarchaeota archaeon]|nr:hypothetical protein [Candidatus Bathyarchaeota archaeon]
MRICFLAIVFLFCAPIMAQQVTPIDKGTPAPYDGVLLDKDAAAKVLSKDEVSKAECQNEKEYEVTKATTSCTVERDILKSNLDAEKEISKNLLALKNGEIERLNKHLEKASVDWGPVWFAGGVVAGISTSLLIFYLAVQTVNLEPQS